jgi:hypothetical protein
LQISIRGRGKLYFEVEIMQTISGHALTIFKDACGVHDFSKEEIVCIEAIADQLEPILKSSKNRAAGKQWATTLPVSQGGDIPRR